jgi:hypothetical protein
LTPNFPRHFQVVDGRVKRVLLIPPDRSRQPFPDGLFRGKTGTYNGGRDTYNSYRVLAYL